MRSLDELIDLQDPGWPLVQEWIAKASNPVEVLPADRARAEATLVELQVTTRSPMGAIALETGGLLVDSGWLRILGSLRVFNRPCGVASAPATCTRSAAKRRHRLPQ